MKRFKRVMLLWVFLFGICFSREVYAATEVMLSPNGVDQTVSLSSGEFANMFDWQWGSGDVYAQYKFTVEEAGYYAFCESSDTTYDWFYSNSDKSYFWYMTGEQANVVHYFQPGTYYLYLTTYNGKNSVAVSMHAAKVSINATTTYSTTDSLAYDVYDITSDWEDNATVIVSVDSGDSFTTNLWAAGLTINLCDKSGSLISDGGYDSAIINAGRYEMRLLSRTQETGFLETIDITVNTRDLSLANTLALGTKISVEEGDLYTINVSGPTYLSMLYTPNDTYIVHPDGTVGRVDTDSGLTYIREAGTVYIEIGTSMSEFAIYLADVQVVKNSDPGVKEICKEIDELYDLEESIMSCYSFKVVRSGGTSYIESYEYIVSSLYVDDKYTYTYGDMLEEGEYHIELRLQSGAIIYEGDLKVVSAEKNKIADLSNGGKLKIPAHTTSYLNLEIEEGAKYIFLSPDELSLQCYDIEEEEDYGLCLRGIEYLSAGTYYIKVDNPGEETQLNIGKLQGLDIQEQPLNDIYWLPTCACDDGWVCAKLDYEIGMMDCVIKTSIGNYTYKFRELSISSMECEILNSKGNVEYGDLYAGNKYRYRLYCDEVWIFDETFNVNGNVKMNEISLGNTYKIAANYYTCPQYYTYTPSKNQQIEVNFKSLSWKTMNVYCYQYVNGNYQLVPHIKETGSADDMTQTYNVQGGTKYVFTAYDLLESSHDEEMTNYEWTFTLIWEETPDNQEVNGDTELPVIGAKKVLSSGQYKVTKSSSKAKEVTYVKPKKAKKTSVSIPATVKIDGYTYKVTAIANKALKGNKKVKSITIGKNVTKIGKEAFNGCKKLKKITIKSAVLKSVGKNAIKNIDKKATIKVPKKQLSKYKKLFKGKTGYKKTMKIKK